MAIDHGLNGIRAELALRIASLQSTRSGVRELAGDLDQVRRIALSAGLFPAVIVTHALESALARGERGPLIGGWLDLLRDAIGCERTDPATCDTYAAACSVRYS